VTVEIALIVNAQFAALVITIPVVDESSVSDVDVAPESLNLIRTLERFDVCDDSVMFVAGNVSPLTTGDQSHFNGLRLSAMSLGCHQRDVEAGIVGSSRKNDIS